MIDEAALRRQYALLRPSRAGPPSVRRTQAQALGRGGIAAVARATGIAPSTIGRKRLPNTDATLERDLLELVAPMTFGCPERPLLWVSKSLKKLAAVLRDKGHRVSANSVRRLLRRLGFSRQGNRRANEGRGHPDRDAQFEHINAQALAFQVAGAPVISVDTKKKGIRHPAPMWPSSC